MGFGLYRAIRGRSATAETRSRQGVARRARIGSIFRFVRRGCKTLPRAAACEQHRRGLGSGAAGSVVQVPPPQRTVEILHPHGAGAPRCSRGYRRPVRSAGRGSACPRIYGRSGPDPSGPALVPGGRNLHRTGLLPYSRWNGSSAVPVLPGDPAPPFPRADPGRDLIHGRALDHVDRFGLRPRAERVMVPAVDRIADRNLDRIHGAGEYRGREDDSASLDAEFWLRARPRIWLLFRIAPESAVRRLAPGSLAGRLQHRGGTGTASGAAADDPAAGTALPLRGGRAHGGDHPFGAGCAHGLALDAGTRQSPQPVSSGVARMECSIRGKPYALPDDRGRSGGIGLVGRFLAKAAADRTHGSASTGILVVRF